MGSFRVYAHWMMLLLQVGVVKWKGHNCYFFVHVLLYIHFDTHSKVTMVNICIIVMKYEWDPSVRLPEGFHWTWCLCLCPSPEYFCFSYLPWSNFDYATCIFCLLFVYTYLHVFLFCINGGFLPVSIQCYSGFFWLFFLLIEKKLGGGYSFRHCSCNRQTPVCFWNVITFLYSHDHHKTAFIDFSVAAAYLQSAQCL